jgi:hypothetical protein
VQLAGWNSSEASYSDQNIQLLKRLVGKKIGILFKPNPWVGSREHRS